MFKSKNKMQILYQGENISLKFYIKLKSKMKLRALYLT